jgi:hypothetical protein
LIDALAEFLSRGETIMRTGRLLQGFIVIAVFASTGAHAGKVDTNATTYYPVDRLYAYTYAWHVSGYPPVPEEFFISGEDMHATGPGNPPYLTHYQASIESIDHVVSASYAWKVKRYSDWPNRVLGDFVINSGSNTAY